VECFVDDDDKEAAPPLRCVPFAVIENERVWMAIESRITLHPPKVRAGGAKDAAFYLFGKRLGLDEIKQACSRALKSPPLRLNVEVGEDEVVGKSRYAPSSVLVSWRETMNAIVGIKSSPKMNGQPFGDYVITLSTTLYVGKQNSDHAEDWFQPTQQQSDSYVAVLKELLGKELVLACKSEDVRQSYNTFYSIKCQ
jgi:hypothetical protein